MSKSTGTVLGILTWLRSQKTEATSTIELSAKSMDGLELVGTWDLAAVAADTQSWAETVCETATEDANGRGVTTCYALRHMRDEKPRGMTQLKRVIINDEKNENAFDGTSTGLAKQLLASLERAQGQVIESQRASLDAMRASQTILGQAFVMIGQLQVQNIQLHNRTIELGTEAAKPSNGKPGAVEAMVEIMAPHIAQEAMKKIMPLLLSGFSDEPAGVKSEVPS